LPHQLIADGIVDGGIALIHRLEIKRAQRMASSFTPKTMTPLIQ